MAKSKKKNNKYLDWIKPIMTFVLGVVVSGGVAYVTATNTIRSSEVNYDNSASGLTSNNVQGAIEELNNNATNYADLISRINNMTKTIYPVGSIYISTTNTNPGTFLGGTWVAFGTGRTLVGYNSGDGDFNSGEKTGGSKTTSYTPAGTNSGGAVQSHTLTAAQIPSHTHGLTSITGIDDNNFINGYGSFLLQNSDTTIGWPTAQNAGYKYGNTGATGSSQGHSHGFTQPTFTGTTANISVVQPYITVFMWKRTA